MKPILVFVYLIGLSFNAFSINQSPELEAKLFAIKEAYNQELYLQKLQYEEERKSEFSLQLGFMEKSLLLGIEKMKRTNFSCVEWVYRTSATREEALKACRGVRSMECVEWVYLGSATRVQAAEACSNVQNMACVEYVYLGSSNRQESAKACAKVKRMDCIEFVYRGPSSRKESALACQGVHDMACVEFAYRGSATRVEAALMCGDSGKCRPKF